jgi:hypothetical protein
MSKKIKDPREQSFRRPPSPTDSPSGRSGREELLRVLFESFAQWVLALGFFTLCLTLSLLSFATLFLAAIGIFRRSQAVDIPLMVLGCSVVLGLKRTSFSIRARSKL